VCFASEASYDVHVGRVKRFLRAVLPPVVVSAIRRVRRFFSDLAPTSHDEPLSDGVVELRLIDKRDLDTIEQAALDSEISRQFALIKERPNEYVARYQELSRAGGGAAFAICDVGGECLGLVTVELHAAGRALLAYWLLQEARGRGRATRALRLVSPWALSQPGVARLELWTSPENKASQRVAERSGFRREGVLRSYHVVDGHREDAVVFSLLLGDLGNRGARASAITVSRAGVLTTSLALANELAVVVQMAG
jgi:[ribosomal protein S5]-alanine N-acetyltransferase